MFKAWMSLKRFYNHGSQVMVSTHDGSVLILGLTARKKYAPLSCLWSTVENIIGLIKRDLRSHSHLTAQATVDHNHRKIKVIREMPDYMNSPVVTGQVGKDCCSGVPFFYNRSIGRGCSFPIYYSAAEQNCSNGNTQRCCTKFKRIGCAGWQSSYIRKNGICFRGSCMWVKCMS